MKEVIETFLQGKLTAFFCILLALPFLIMMVSLSRRFQPMLIEKRIVKNLYNRGMAE